MNRKECMDILGDKTHPMYEELHHIFYTNHNIAKEYFKKLGYDSTYVLHHKDINCNNYEMWDVNELEPMTKEDHSRLHYVYYKQGLGSDESKKKAHDTIRDKYKSGELVIWNKGLTKEDNPNLASKRKGKTGDDYPFLKASKKGRSGG